MYNSNKDCVLIFVRCPIVGEVKTRLAKETGPRVAADLYRNFIIDILGNLRELNVDLRVFFDPPNALGVLQGLIGDHYFCVPQMGDDLGLKMKNAFSETFDEGLERVVLVGSDSPDLPVDFLERAFITLGEYDAVIGPSVDGGYYLMGFTKEGFCPQAFDGIDWGSGRVFQQTFNILKRHKRDVYRLPTWHDVDNLSDLELLFERNKNTAFRYSQTIRCITSNIIESIYNV